MNVQRLHQAEQAFLMRYPGGFDNEELMVVINKKHKGRALMDKAQAWFSPVAFKNTEQVVADIVKLVSQSSMVSVFEKTKFRGQIKLFNSDEKNLLALSLKHSLHGNREKGFDMLVGLLHPYKLAKWPLITVIPNYYHPEKEVLIKPTTVKGIISTFSLPDLTYKPTPSFAFYEAYRKTILHMKAEVNPNLAPSNAAFCGFLMMSLDKESDSVAAPNQ